MPGNATNKRKLSSASDSDSDARKRKAKLATMAKLRSEIKLSLVELNRPPPPPYSESLCESARFWLTDLPYTLMLQVLCAYNPETKAKSFAISFQRWAELAACSKPTYLLFFTDSEEMRTNLWSNITHYCLPTRRDGNPVPEKFLFVRPFVEKFWCSTFAPPVLEAMEAYLNRFGIGYCHSCGMYVKIHAETDLKQSLIPLSPFRMLTPQELAAQPPPHFDDTQILKPYEDVETPDWMRAMLSLRNSFPCKYCCVNCGAVPSQHMFGISATSVFDACDHRSRPNKAEPDNHCWKELEFELKRPDKSVVPGQFEYCFRCGLLRLEKDAAAVASEKCPDCEKSECVCDLCESCGRAEGSCKCIICDSCNLCQTGCSKPCRKTPCQCDDGDSSKSYERIPSPSFSSSSSSSPSSSESSE